MRTVLVMPSKIVGVSLTSIFSVCRQFWLGNHAVIENLFGTQERGQVGALQVEEQEVQFPTQGWPRLGRYGPRTMLLSVSPSTEHSVYFFLTLPFSLA